MSQPATAKRSSSGSIDSKLETETSFAATKEIQRKSRGPRWGTVIFTILLLAGAGWGARYVQRLLTHAETDDAYLTSHVHYVNAHVPGTISEVDVTENTFVKAGDVLFRLDPRDLEAKLAQADAQLAQSEALINFTTSQIAGAHAKVAEAQAQATKAEADFARMQELNKTKVASKQEFDAAKASVESARASLTSAKASAEGMASGMRVAEAQLQNSRVGLDNAKLQLSYNRIVAPVSGKTSKRSAELGAYVQPGQTLVAIVEPEVWVEANFKETQLAKMRAGQAVEIRVDALPGHVFTGRVESFSPASGAQFAMLPPDNATGNFTKVVQRVPVKIRFDPEGIRGFEEKLRAGTSAVVAVEI